MAYRHFFFDMDKTITPSRRPMLPKMRELLSSLTEDIVVVSGQRIENMREQCVELKAAYLAQNGNHAFDTGGKELWHTPLSALETEEVLAHIRTLIAALDEKPREEYNPIEHRGAQISFSLVGNTAPHELKDNFDPDRKKRLQLLKQFPFKSETMMVVTGGSTTLDYIPKERHKGTNVKKFIEVQGWNPAECVYFGDGLHPGGNDELVIGVIDTIPVIDHFDCYHKLVRMLLGRE